MTWNKKHQLGKTRTVKIEMNKWPKITVKKFSHLIIYTNLPVKLQIESKKIKFTDRIENRRTKVYTDRKGELEFTDGKYELLWNKPSVENHGLGFLNGMQGLFTCYLHCLCRAC